MFSPCRRCLGYLFLLFETYRITGVDISLFDRERGEGVVGVVAWLVSRRLARALLEDVRKYRLLFLPTPFPADPVMML